MQRFTRKIVISLGAVGVVVPSAFAQPAADPIRSRYFDFREDTSQGRKAIQATRQQTLRADKPDKKVVDVKAPDLAFESDKKTLTAKGGILLSGGGVEAQADSTSVNTETKDAILDGKVLFSAPSAEIQSERAAVNLDDETGEFRNASFKYEDGGYNLRAKELFKLSETRYRLIDAEMSTCECEDGSCPWTINSDDTRITQNGYAQAWDTTIWFHGVPILYTPYFAFPAKFVRTAGLLAPSIGWSRQNGMQYTQPIFVPLDDSTDLTIKPFLETKTRMGTYLDYDKIFSKENRLESRFLYSNESLRDGALRGTVTTGLIDPEIDENRFGLYVNDLYRAPETAILPVRALMDIHYVSDDLMSHEFGDNKIIDPTARYATSTVLVRSAFNDYFSGEVSGEYNDLIHVSPDQPEAVAGNPNAIRQDKLTFNRLPELSLSYLKSFRPIDNPYGLRLVTKADLTQTYFERDQGYDGTRNNFNPQASVPFHISNYLSGSMGGGAYIRNYALSDQTVPVFNAAGTGQVLRDPVTGVETELPDSTTSSVPYFQGALSTAVEKVYDVDQDGFLATLAGVGKDNQDNQLVRVKHVVEPTLRYLYIPDISQGDVPQFDAIDRITERSLVRYGLSSSFVGRYSPRHDVATGIPELTPELRSFPTYDTLQAIPTFGESDTLGSLSGGNSLRDGTIRQLLGFSVEQGYDFRQQHRRDEEIEAGIDNDARQPFTDITSSLFGSPTENLTFRFDNFYNTTESRITGWATTTRLTTDRGDAVYARYSFTGPARGNPDGDASIDQIDGGGEAVVNDRLKFGLYTRYDLIQDDVLYNRLALRFYSACNCWHIDVGYSDQINPDNQTYYFNFTLTGLGSVNQDLYSIRNNQ